MVGLNLQVRYSKEVLSLCEEIVKRIDQKQWGEDVLIRKNIQDHINTMRKRIEGDQAIKLNPREIRRITKNIEPYFYGDCFSNADRDRILARMRKIRSRINTDL